MASLCWFGHQARIDAVGPTAANVAAFFLSLCRDYGLVPQALKDGVSAEPLQQVGNGAGQNYPEHAKFCVVVTH